MKTIKIGYFRYILGVMLISNIDIWHSINEETMTWIVVNEDRKNDSVVTFSGTMFVQYLFK